MAFLRALSKMGLLTLSPEEMGELEKKSKKSPEMSMAEIDKLLADDAAAEAAAGGAPSAAVPSGVKPTAPAARPGALAPKAPTPAAKPVSTITSPTPSKPGIEVGPFEALYAAANLGGSPYPAEKLLRLLDGLQAMDEQTRRMAVLAMDAADDSWTIADPVMDAKRKIKVLADTKSGLDRSLAAAEQKVQDEIKRLDAYAAEANKTIREKVAGLEAQLTSEMQQVGEQRATLGAMFQRDRETAAAEQARLDVEVARLGTVPRHFETALRAAARPGS